MHEQASVTHIAKLSGELHNNILGPIYTVYRDFFFFRYFRYREPKTEY